MHDYVVAKIVSLAIPVLLAIGALFWASPITEYWWFLLIVTILLGYIHSVVGLLYQVQSIMRNPQRNRLLPALLLLFVISLGICVWFIVNDLVAIFILFLFTYFILHGYLNEQALLTMQAKITAPLSYFIGLTLSSTALVYASFTHDSFFFTNALSFVSMSAVNKEEHILTSLKVDPLVIGYFLLGLASVTFLWSFRYITNTLIKVVTVLHVVVFLLLMMYVYPLGYIYLLHIFLGYHFILWSVVFFQKFYSQQKNRLPTYITIHLVITLPLLGLLALYMGTSIAWVQVIGAVVFDIRTFMTVSFVHITISLLNEPWFKKWIL